MAELSCVQARTAPEMSVMSAIPRVTSAAAPLCASKECHLSPGPALGFTLPSADTAIRRELSKLTRLVCKKQGQELSSARQCEVKLLPVNDLSSWIPTAALSAGMLQEAADGRVCLSLHSRFCRSVPRHNCDREENDLHHEPKVRSEK